MVHVFMKQSAAKSLEAAQKMGCFPSGQNDVFCMDFDLDQRDLSKELASKEASQLNQLKKRMEQQEDVMVWTSRNAADLCGLYFLCSQFEKNSGKIWIVDLPEVMENKRTGQLQFCQNWAQVLPESFSEVLPHAKLLSQKEVSLFASRWKELVLENAPLRLVINGSLVSVPEDFYDSFLLEQLSGKPKTKANLIGSILGKADFDLSEKWIRRRIGALTETKEIQEIPNAQNPDQCLLCRRDHS